MNDETIQIETESSAAVPADNVASGTEAVPAGGCDIATDDEMTETEETGAETEAETETETETETEAETLQEIDTAETLQNIYNDVHLILVFTILTFASACMRGWRNHTLKGGR